MNEREKYLFDLQGYIVLEDVLSPEQLQACNDAIDAQRATIRRRSGDELLSGGSQALVGEQGRGDIGGMLTWPAPHCRIWRELLIHPRVVECLREILDDGFRLDHLYGILMTTGTEGHVLHGGGHAANPTHYYRFRNNQMRCGLTVVSYVLTDQGPGDGGFACVPGSHKSNYPAPPELRRLEDDLGCVVQPTARAGSVIVFTEALTHGTLPWNAAHERRAMLYKYSPGAISYSSSYLPGGVGEAIDEFTPAQRAVLEPPYHPRRPHIE
jgi:ectoine hydroxylase-related dioxygenase (phytanoyl-CoA dioxygenase family)